MKKLAKYIFSPFLKRFENIHYGINENKSSIDKLSANIEHAHNTFIDEKNKDKTIISQLTDELVKIKDEIENLKSNYNNGMSDINKSLISIFLSNKKLSETSSETLHLVESNDLRDEAKTILSILNIISKRNQYNKVAPHILFLIHNMNTWYSVANLYFELSNDPDLRVTIASIPRSFPGVGGYSGEDITSAALSKIGVNHMRISSYSDKDISTILTTLSPDVIFRQSPWDHDIPPGFGSNKINFAKLCYVPYYAINIVKNISSGTDFDFQSNQDLHNNSWRIYCDTEHAYAELCKNSLMRGLNARYFGHPKLDYIHTKMKETRNYEGTNKKERTINILWAPHHSVDEGWLSFGTFDKNYLDFLRYAEENKNIHIKLRPHPALFDFMRAKSEETKNSIDNFLSRWESLVNTSTDFDYDYVSSFEWSDVLVTDGISFIVEYPLFHKPSIFIENENHATFNELGYLAAKCNHITNDFTGVMSLLDKFSDGTLEDKSNEVEYLEKILLPNKGIVHKIIAKDIKSNI
jgi:archaellum component FlaC